MQSARKMDCIIKTITIKQRTPQWHDTSSETGNPEIQSKTQQQIALKPSGMTRRLSSLRLTINRHRKEQTMNEQIKWRISVLVETFNRDRLNSDRVTVERFKLVREFNEEPTEADVLSFRDAIAAKGHTIIRAPEIKTLKHTGRLRKSL
jgi:hypothetical protein